MTQVTEAIARKDRIKAALAKIKRLNARNQVPSAGLKLVKAA
jgi:hypothetical protein